MKNTNLPSPTSYPWSQEGMLAPGILWRRWDLPHVVPAEFGEWALHCELYSKGSDFTSPVVNYMDPGTSALRRLWARVPSEKLDLTTAWIMLKEGVGPVGVVAWEAFERPASENGCLGRISMWMQPQMRRRGLMGALLEEAVVPALHAASTSVDGAHIRASDATVKILSSVCSVSIVPSFSLPSADPGVGSPRPRHLRLSR